MANPQALLAKAIECQTTGRPEEAERICREILAKHPVFPPAKMVLAQLLLRRGQPPPALELLNEIAGEDPSVVRIPMFHLALARALTDPAMSERRIEAYRQVIELAPFAAEAYEEFARCLTRNSKQTEAIEVLRKAAEKAPTRTGLRFLAYLLSEEGAHEESVEFDRIAVALDPGFAQGHEMLGVGLQALGKFDEALECFQRAAELAPDTASPLFRITRIKKISADDANLIESLEAIAARSDSDLDPLGMLGVWDHRRLAHYGLGKAYEDLEKYELSAKNFRSANELALKTPQHGRQPFDAEQHTRWVDRLIETFTPEFFKANANIGRDSEAPIFVVGMIRSGTTLVEQILSNHPQVWGGGEIPYWTGPQSTQLTQEILSGSLVPEHVQKAATDYLKTHSPKDKTFTHFTDKMPLNYLALGLIHLALPNARIIHCKRDPLDTCLSVFTTPFTNGAEFCHDPQKIVSVYRDYLRLMSHWTKVLPNLFEVEYESLVIAPSPVTQAMIAFCGLPWDEACLRHNENPHGIDTPSHWQARQAIYTTSVGRWNQYKQWLPEFAELE